MLFIVRQIRSTIPQDRHYTLLRGAGSMAEAPRRELFPAAFAFCAYL